MSNQIIDPRSLKFGALAAERDVIEGLKYYFLESEAFKALRDGKKSVALGNRGSGKSAVFKMIAEHERANGKLVIELSPDDFSYELLAKTMLPEERGSWAKQGAYTAAWKYLIYVITMKEITRTGSRLKTGPAAMIYEYLRDNHGNINPNPIGLLISYLKRLEGIKVGSYQAGFKSKELHQLYKLEEIESLLDPLDELCKKRRTVVLVDELDKGWDKSEDAIAFVAGLFQSMVSISQRTPSLRVLISLRRELYESIPALYDDAQKYRDLVQHIEWNEEELLALVARRIAYSVPELSDKTPQECWDIVFSEVLDYRRTKSFNYIVDRSLYRPREILQFAIMIRDVILDANGKLPATYELIAEAEQAYSEERLKDIAAEYRFQYPGLRSVFETFRGRTYTYERTELEQHCLAISTGEAKVDKEAQSWCQNMNPEGVDPILRNPPQFPSASRRGLA
jgi:hypothetical protein